MNKPAPQPLPTRSEEDEDTIDLLQVGAMLWNGKFVIAAFVALAVSAGAFFVAVTQPSYQADALLQLEERGGRLALPAAMRDLVENDPRTITEIEILRSRMVIGQAVADLNHDWRAEPLLAPVIGVALTKYRLPIPEFEFLGRFARHDDAIELDYLEVSPRWIGRPATLTYLGEGRFEVEYPDGSRGFGSVGQTIAGIDGEFAFSVGTIEGRVGRAFTLRQISELEAIRSIREALSISERGRQSGILEARLVASRPPEAQRILAAVVNAYVRQNISRSAAEAESSLAFIEQQLPEAEQDVLAAERALNAFRQQQQSIDLSFETQSLLTQIGRIEAELLSLQAEEDSVSQRYTPNHPVYRQLLQQRDRLEDRLTALRAEVGDLPETQREVLNLTRNLELSQQIYTQLLTRAQEMRVLRASTIGNVRVLDSARASPRKVAPRNSLVLALSIVLGGMVGIAFVLVRNWLRKGVRGAEQIEQAGLPVFATINHSRLAERAQRGRGRAEILALTAPSDLSVEAFRSLRTSLHFGMLDARTRSLAITSSAPAAGKSFTSTNLAVVAAQAGQKVCLVDSDLRRGQLRKFFGVAKNTPGLAEILAGEARLEEVLVDGPVEGLRFLPTGRYPPNPSELLMRRTFAEVVQALDGLFDLTIFDCPPVLAVTDPVIIARGVGATVAVVRFDQTPLGEVEAMRRAFETAGLKLSGAILNGFDPRRSGAGYSYNYNYNYRYEYRSKAD